MSRENLFDVCVIGGGINGTGIAADAAGRGLSVCLFEQSDLGAGTSSASSKLIHGGLRYLEHREFKLVREALHEREILLRAAPHIVWPLRFVLPHLDSMRPRWMLRAGLFLYDRLSGHTSLPRSRSVSLAQDPVGPYLRADITRGFSYWDCWVDDARLVVLNAQAAARRDALVRTRCRVTEFTPDNRETGLWRVEVASENGPETFFARAVVNAAGPWVEQVAGLRTQAPARPTGQKEAVRLVKGSHIVVPRFRGLNDAVLLQHRDGRVVFILPFGDTFTLIGTTDEAFEGDPTTATCSTEEREYLLRLTNRHFVRQLSSADVCHSFAGVRPLFDDSEGDPSKVTRDYRLVLDQSNAHPPLLTVFGGKITTYRRLAEDAVNQLDPLFPHQKGPWTATCPLPGGELKGTFEDFVKDLVAQFPGFDAAYLLARARRYGSETMHLLGDSKSIDDLGRTVGPDLTEREIHYLRDHEWAMTAEDVLWRRTKIGLKVAGQDKEKVARDIEEVLASK